MKSMKPFYVSIDTAKDNLLISEIGEDGQRRYRQERYKPNLFVIGKEDDPKCKYKSIHNAPMKKIRLPSISKYKELVEMIKGTEKENIVGGNVHPIFQYISEKYDALEPDFSKIRVCYLDIETAPNAFGEFADPEKADGEILSIAVKMEGRFVAFGCKDFKDTSEIVYIKCQNEKHLLKTFLTFWERYTPDVITGWFISTFDMPYLFNRITNLFGENEARRLSPFRVAYLKNDLDPINKNIKEVRRVLHLGGIQELDYVRLYRKFGVMSEIESNALNFVAEKELGEKKVEYDGSLFRLYHNDYNLFIEYNVHDVRLVEKLEEKLNLLQLVYSLAYYSKVNFRDVFFQVRMWDAIIYNYLIKKNIVVPFSSDNLYDGGYVGAYVKDPQIGMKDWVVSFDVTSLYPHLILQFNISPDTLLETNTKDLIADVSIEKTLEGEISEQDQKFMKENNCCMAVNHEFFSNKKVGFLPEIIETLFQERKKYKKIALENKKKYEETRDEKYYQKYKINNIFQNIKKICLNSAYGAMGNRFFRFYDVRLAQAVTLSGQLVIRWIERSCNEFLNQKFNTTNKDYCIASDTDSVYLDLSELKGKVKDSDEVDMWIKEDLLKYVGNKLEILRKMLNCRKNRIELKREIIADRGIFIAKKRYCLNVLDNEGVKYHEPELKLMGVEAVKSSTPKVCRDLMREAIKIMLQKSEKDLQDFYKKVLDDYHNIMKIEDIAFPRTINGLDKYTMSSKSIPIHVFGALKYNKLIKQRGLKELEEIKNGDKIRFVYLKEPNWLNSHVFSFPANRSFPKEFHDIREIVDYKLMLEKSLKAPLDIILKKIGWEIEAKESILDLFVVN